MKLEYDELKKKSIEQNMRIIELSKEKQDLEENVEHSKNQNVPTRVEPTQEIVIAEDSKIVMVPKFISFKLSEQDVVKLIDSCLVHYSKDKKQNASMLKAKEQYDNGGKLFDYAVTVFKIALTRRRKDMKYWFEKYDDFVNKNKIVVTTNFDKLYEGLCHAPEYVKFDYTNTRSIIGSIKAPENIIIKAHVSIDDTEK